MTMGSDAKLPSVSVGQIDFVAQCRRRLAQQLDPELRSAPGSDPSLRLWGTIIEAIQLAHRDAIESESRPEFRTDPPAGLSVEEQLLFSRAMEHYDEAFGDEPGTLHERSGDIVKRPSAIGEFQLTGRVDLVFRHHDRPLEIRRIKLKEAPAQPPQTRRSDIGLTTLLRSPNESAVTAAVVRTLWTHTNASITETAVTGEQIRDFRLEVQELVVQARANPEEATSGWWCNSCRFTSRCPVIPQASIESLSVHMDDGVMPPLGSDNSYYDHFEQGAAFAVIDGDTDFMVTATKSGTEDYGDDW
jgi:PD-(D/E)XK nuclease superfamily